MSTPATIRPATPDDLVQLHRLLTEALPLDCFSARLLREKLFPQRWPPGMAAQTLVAERSGRVIATMQGLTRAEQRRAWIGLFATHPDHRNRGHAARLFDTLRAGWGSEIEQIDVLAIPGNYFTPGLDPRYTSGLCFLESRGFARVKDCVNLTCRLSHDFDTRADEERLAGEGVVIRRATAEDASLLDAFFAAQFGADWRYEAQLALERDPPALHLAVAGATAGAEPQDTCGSRLIAFSAHSTQNREWGFFGPMGTTPAARGRGIGRVLLLRCLNDLRAAGHQAAVIPWVGPIAFYHRAAACDVERVFWHYRLRLSEAPGGKIAEGA